MTKHQEEAVLSAFFTEIGIISQLSFKAFEQVLPHGLTVSQFSVLITSRDLATAKVLQYSPMRFR